MIQDKQLIFSEAQVITATADSTNIINGGQANFDGGNEALQLLLTVNETFLAAGAATLTVSWVTATDAAFTTPETLVQTAAIPKATLVKGYQLPLDFVPANVKQYNKLVFTVATGPFTAGKVDAGLLLARQTNK